MKRRLTVLARKIVCPSFFLRHVHVRLPLTICHLPLSPVLFVSPALFQPPLSLSDCTPLSLLGVQVSRVSSNKRSAKCCRPAARSSSRVKLNGYVRRLAGSGRDWLSGRTNARGRRREAGTEQSSRFFEKKNFNSILLLISRNLIPFSTHRSKVTAQKSALITRSPPDNRSSAKFLALLPYSSTLLVSYRRGNGTEKQRRPKNRSLSIVTDLFRGTRVGSRRLIAIKEAAFDERSRVWTLKKKCTGEKSPASFPIKSTLWGWVVSLRGRYQSFQTVVIKRHFRCSRARNRIATYLKKRYD